MPTIFGIGNRREANEAARIGPTDVQSSEEGTGSQSEGGTVAVALELAEQPIYQARTHTEDSCCVVVVWGLTPILSRKNRGYVILALVLMSVFVTIGFFLSVSESDDSDSELDLIAESTLDVSADVEFPKEINSSSIISNSSSYIPIAELISSKSVHKLFLDPETSQGKAYQWLMNEYNSTLYEDDVLLTRYATMVLYYGLRGENWINSENYGTNSSVCSWNGITCSDSVNPSDISLRNNGVSGTIADEISFLFNLSSIDISLNNVAGTIPDTLYDLSSLKLLYIHGNLLEGTISTKIENLKELEYFSVRTNRFEGLIPSEFGTLQNLKITRFYRNNFTGPFPEFLSNCSSLQIANFGQNKMSGALSPKMGALKNLRYLYFYENFFTGTVPEEWSGLEQLRKIGVWNNALTGTFPNNVTQLPFLGDISVGSNNFTGPLPLNDHLEEIWFYANNFNESIPEDIGNLENLRIMVGWKNMLKGTIPESIGNLSALTMLQLTSNQITGTIPSSVGKMSRLSSFHVGGNLLSGTVPSEIGLLETLNSMEVNENNLTGIIPPEICDLELEHLAGDCQEINCTCCTFCSSNDAEESNERKLKESSFLGENNFA